MQGVRSALGSWDKGSSFVDNYMKGTQIRIAKEQEKRSKRKEQFSFWAGEQKEFQRQKNLYGNEQADAWASARRGSEEYEFHQIPDSIKLASTGSTITLTGEKAINAIMRINKLPDTDEGRKAAKANKDAFGYGDAMVFNISGSGDNGKINHEETRKIDTHRLKSATSKTDIMKKQTEIAGAGNTALKTLIDQETGEAVNVVIDKRSGEVVSKSPLTGLSKTKPSNGRSKKEEGFKGAIQALDELDALSSKLSDWGNQPLNMLAASISTAFGSEAYAQFETTATLASKQLATAFENGRLSDKDYEVYRKALPDNNDTINQRSAKSKILRRLIKKAVSSNDEKFNKINTNESNLQELSDEDLLRELNK